MPGLAQSIQKMQLDSAMILMNDNKHQQAKIILQKAISAYEKNNDKNADYATCLHQIAICMSEEAPEKAMLFAQEAMNLRKELFGELNEDYINSLNNVGVFYRILGQYDKAVQIHKKVLELSLQLTPIHKNTAMYAQCIALDYEMAGDKNNALAAYENALKYYEKFSDPYGHLLEKLAIDYYDLNNQEKAMYYLNLIEEHNCHELSKECHETDCMLERARYYAATDNQTEAKKCFLSAISMSKNFEEKELSQYEYVRFLSDNRNYEETKAYCQTICDEYERNNIENDKYTEILRYLAFSEYFLNNIEEAIATFNKYIETHERLHLKQDNIYYLSLSILASTHYLDGEFEKSLQIYEKIKNHYSTTPRNINYADAIRHIADIKVKQQKYQEAADLYKQAIEIYKEQGDDASLNTAISSLNICYTKGNIKQDNISNQAKEQEKALLNRLLEENLTNLEIYKKTFGEESLAYAQTLGSIAEQYQTLGNYEKATEFYKKFMPAGKAAIKNDFRTLNPTERALVWEEYSYIIESLMRMTLLQNIDYKTIASLAYDAQLLSKGILLNSYIEFEKVLRSTGDKELSDIYEQIKKNKKQITEIAEKGDNSELLLSLKQTNDALEITLSEKCAEYRDYTDYLNYTWQDVQKKLGKKDVAIEFAEIKNELLEQDNTVTALLITHDCDSPYIIPVCKREELEYAAKEQGIYEDRNFGILFWNSITPYLKHKERIYFSPDAELNALAIEFLTVDGSPMFEKYDIYRLSSTKELCKTKNTYSKKNIALIGGVDYSDEPTTDAPADEATKNIPDPESSLARSGYDGIIAFPLLTYSLQEVEGIKGTLAQEPSFDIKEYIVGTNAGKENFKNLDNKDINVIHISTHGAYQTADKYQEKTDPMNSSFLVMAGANTLSISPDDAMVTAKEIAEMNFRNCELAVLSACESGLGKLDKDGVFGLQRGFKNAGVNSLLMSLKKIYDQQSAEMMILFYKNWIKEKSKHKAFVETLQQLIKQGWKSEDWASFILLDALD